jgi:hypothetical protein
MPCPREIWRVESRGASQYGPPPFLHFWGVAKW